MNHYKIIGNLFGNNIEFSCDFSRWLVGFGWITHHKYKYVQRLSVHCNLGPFVVILTIL